MSATSKREKMSPDTLALMRRARQLGVMTGTDAERLLAHVTIVEAELDYLKRREESTIEACERVADGGQYRADIVSAIQRIRRERDEARVDVATARAEGEAIGRRRGRSDIVGLLGSMRVDETVLDVLRRIREEEGSES